MKKGKKEKKKYEQKVKRERCIIGRGTKSIIDWINKVEIKICDSSNKQIATIEDDTLWLLYSERSNCLLH